MADPGERPGGSPPSPVLFSEMRPEGPKKIFWRPAPPSSRGLDDRPPPLSEGYLDPPLRGSIYPAVVPWWGGMILRVRPRVKWFFNTWAR